jgi:hypothetical protein
MGVLVHHLISASDGKRITQLTHIYAETIEQATKEALQWRDETYPALPILHVRAQPEGFQAGFRRLPGKIEEIEEEAL